MIPRLVRRDGGGSVVLPGEPDVEVAAARGRRWPP